MPSLEFVDPFPAVYVYAIVSCNTHRVWAESMLHDFLHAPCLLFCKGVILRTTRDGEVGEMRVQHLENRLKNLVLVPSASSASLHHCITVCCWLLEKLAGSSTVLGRCDSGVLKVNDPVLDDPLCIRKLFFFLFV